MYVWLSALLPLGFLPALLAPSIPAMAILITSAGLLIAPQAAACNQLIGSVAPAGAVTEAYAWPVTATLVGFAPGRRSAARWSSTRAGSGASWPPR